MVKSGIWAALAASATAGVLLAGCASEPRYPIRPMDLSGAQGRAPAGPMVAAPMAPPAPYEAPPPMAAPVEAVEGGALAPAAASPAYPAPTRPMPANPALLNPSPVSQAPSPRATAPAGGLSSMPLAGEAAYVIQPGDTISGVGRRFRTPVQTLIDLNDLGPRGSINAGQAIRLPANALDTGPDPYATGPAPVGVEVAETGAVLPPPPAPPSGNPAAPPVRSIPAPAPRPAPVTPTPSAPVTTRPAPAPSAPVSTGAVSLQWPVRGDIVRRFGPVGVSERNNGINIGASAGAAVSASAAGRVAYVGDDLVGQGLTVVIVHRDGWRTVYGHLGSTTVEDGDDVRAGQQVGTVGLTAGDGRPSMHFETRRMNGDDPVAIDPLTVLPR